MFRSATSSLYGLVGGDATGEVLSTGCSEGAIASIRSICRALGCLRTKRFGMGGGYSD